MARTLLLLLALTPTLPAQSSEPARLTARTVQFPAGSLTLRHALEQVRRQTGYEIQVDDSVTMETAVAVPTTALDFWPALDALARAAELRVHLYHPSGKVALARGPWREEKLSYHGPFRVAARRLTAARLIDAPTGGTLRLQVEVAWEPGVRPLLLEARPRQMQVQEAGGRLHRPTDEGGGFSPVAARLATTFDVALPLPPRAVPRLAVVEGRLRQIVAPRMLTMDFDTVAALGNGGGEQRRDGVKVRVTAPTLDPERWTLQVEVTNPPGGPKFESFQSWTAHNRIELVAADGQIFPNNRGASEDLSREPAVLEYHFADEPARKLMRGDPATWRVRYTTPAALVVVDLPFRFRELDLP